MTEKERLKRLSDEVAAKLRNGSKRYVKQRLKNTSPEVHPPGPCQDCPLLDRDTKRDQ
jgi:hypothetical protein